MPSARSVLEQLRLDELRAILARYELSATDGRNRARIIDAIVAPGGPPLQDVLSGLKRARLKEICRALDLDDRGKTLSSIARRLVGVEEQEAEVEAAAEAPIASFQIDGFKSIVRLSVELGTVNVFIGANGSGKSNILEALGVMGAAAFRSVEPEALRNRGVRPGLPTLYKTSFEHGERIRRIITLAVKSSSALYRLGLDNPISATLEPWRIVSETLVDGEKPILTRSPRGTNVYEAGRPRSLSPPQNETAAKAVLQYVEDGRGARALVDALIDFAIFSPTTDVLRGLTGDVSRQPLGLSGSGLAVAVKDMINRDEDTFGPWDLAEIWELIEWADDVAAVPSQQAPVSPAVSLAPIVLRFRDRFMRKARNTLSAYDASEGALYVLFLLTLAAHPKAPRVFAVDNFDHALHPRLAARLTRMVAQQLLEDGRRQMLLTTHNPLVLDGLDLSNDRVRLFAVERKDDGATTVERIELTPALLAEAEKGLSLSRLWVMGRLGAVPRDL